MDSFRAEDHMSSWYVHDESLRPFHIHSAGSQHGVFYPPAGPQRPRRSNRSGLSPETSSAESAEGFYLCFYGNMEPEDNHVLVQVRWSSETRSGPGPYEGTDRFTQE